MADTKNTGSPTGEPLYLSVGFLRRPHGVKGEIIMDLHTDFPERMKKGRKLFVGEDHKPMILASVRTHGSGLLVRFSDVDTPEEAGLYRNQWVYVQTKDVPLPEGQHYKHELLGLNVVDENDRPLGELVEILETGANDVYVVRDDAGKEILLPNIPSVILDLDIGRGLLRVHLLEGL
ncbi:MAG: 16S rRNA processing protein RimM [Anaerolineales bacterium]|nr:16S rRNA processing protein RimM [Anaerolineae bacterium]PWB71802.1 MAG: 16S rRNA processing protein RimM [Anaerolineales bacterium]